MGITSILDAQNRKGTTDFAFHGYVTQVCVLNPLVCPRKKRRWPRLRSASRRSSLTVRCR